VATCVRSPLSLSYAALLHRDAAFIHLLSGGNLPFKFLFFSLELAFLVLPTSAGRSSISHLHILKQLFGHLLERGDLILVNLAFL